MNEKVVYLETKTFFGQGGGHYYCNLIGEKDGDREEIGLRFKMTLAQAKRFNTEERRDYGSKHAYTYREGMSTGRFFGLDDAIEKAKEVWKEHFPDAEILVRGRHYNAEPQPVLIGPKDWRAKISTWLAHGKRIGWHDSKDWGAICDQFWSEMKERGYR